MKLAIFTVMTPPYTPEECIERFAELGYDGIEWRVRDDEPADGNRATLSIEELRERGKALGDAAAAKGLEIPSVATYVHSGDMAEVERALSAIAAAGVTKCRIGPGRWDAENETWDHAMAAARDRYAQVAQLAEWYGVRTLVETHGRQLGPTVVAARRIIDGLDPKWVGIMWDPGNQVNEGLERYDVAISAAGEYLGEVHVKNGRWVTTEQENGRLGWKFEWAPMREGVVDWPAVVAELKQRDYDGWLVFEDFSQEAPLEERLADNVAWFRELLG